MTRQRAYELLETLFVRTRPRPRRAADQLSRPGDVRDLDEAARGRANVRAHSDVAEIYIESSGELTVIERSDPGRSDR